MLIAAHNGARIWGGAERALARLLAGLQARGHRVVLYCNSPMVAQRASELGVPTRIVPLGGDIMIPHAVRLAARLRALRPDALIVGTYKKLLLAGLGAHLGGVPRVVVRVGLETDVPRSAKYRLALSRWVDAVVVNAGRIRPAFAGLFGDDDTRLLVIHNGVSQPPRALPPGELRRVLGIPPSARVMGTVARLDVQKRLDRLLTAVAQLEENVHCIIAGDGPESSRLDALAAELGLAERVHFLGNREDVGDVYSALDLMVVSSDREGLSNSMLEALASGVPVISTPVSGAEDALEAFGDGRKPGEIVAFDAGAIATVMGRILSDAGERAVMAGAAAERAQDRFSVDRMLDRWEDVLRGPGR